jgi:putative tryptophan/tyrosine transport system substrate-binding protein
MLKRLPAWSLVLSAVLAAGAARAENVAVVLSDTAPACIELFESLKREVEKTGNERFKVWNIPASTAANNDKDIFRTDFYHLVVAVGARAAKVVLDIGAKPPVLATMIPKAAFDKLAQSHAGAWSAIYLDQPAERQLRFVRAVLPGKIKLGVMYGPNSAALAADLDQAASEQGIEIDSQAVRRQEEVGPALTRMLERVDSLLAVPDAQVFNRTTLQPILLATFRANDPMIGFSEAYVKAGALAAVYSSPRQIARQAGEIVNELRVGEDGRLALPAPRYPRYWSIAVNRDVALRLNIAVETDDEISRSLGQVMEGGQ